MAKREPVTMYFDEETKAAIQREANRADKSVSTYCRDLFEAERQRRTQEELVEEQDAEQCLTKIIADGFENFESVAEDLRDQHGLMIDILQEIEEDLDGVTVSGDTDEDTTEIQERLRRGDRE